MDADRRLPGVSGGTGVGGGVECTCVSVCVRVCAVRVWISVDGWAGVLVNVDCHGGGRGGGVECGSGDGCVCGSVGV